MRVILKRITFKDAPWQFFYPSHRINNIVIMRIFG